MAKQSGLGDNFYIAGYNISGDVGSLGRVGGGPALGEVTGIDKSAIERLGLLRDGGMEFTSFFNDAAGRGHDVLSDLPRTDVIATYFRGTTFGNAAASCVAKQIDYNPTRGADGSLTLTTTVQANAYGLEWGRMLTPGVFAETLFNGTPPDGNTLDNGAASTFGAQMYYQVFAFVGTDATLRFQHSTDNSSWSNIGDSATITGVGLDRLVANTSSINRYLRVVAITSGGATSMSYAAMVVRNETAVVF